MMFIINAQASSTGGRVSTNRQGAERTSQAAYDNVLRNTGSRRQAYNTARRVRAAARRGENVTIQRNV